MKKTFFTLFAVVAGLLDRVPSGGCAPWRRGVRERPGKAARVERHRRRNGSGRIRTRSFSSTSKVTDGQVVRWVVEASNPPDMQNRGWTQ